MDRARQPLLIIESVSRVHKESAVRDPAIETRGHYYVFNSCVGWCLSVLIGYVNAVARSPFVVIEATVRVGFRK
tara:strand:- start:511 stop:732 length:222 start_codon:yes stop_codon:yes gene_type:complete